MANKRDLKRGISYVCAELMAEGFATATYSNNTSKENLNTLLSSIIRTHDDYIRRVSHPEPGMPARKYYKALVQSFSNEVNDYVDAIQNAH